MRQRDTVLQVLEDFRHHRPNASLLEVIGFLYICENEGLNLAELADLVRTSRANATRISAALEGTKPPQSISLVRKFSNPRPMISKSINLTTAGQDLKNTIEEHIARAVPISATQMRSA